MLFVRGSVVDCYRVLRYYMSCLLSIWLGFFFFQAEDGIRVVAVTGVQTCALPILTHVSLLMPRGAMSMNSPFTNPSGDTCASIFVCCVGVFVLSLFGVKTPQE